MVADEVVNDLLVDVIESEVELVSVSEELVRLSVVEDVLMDLEVVVAMSELEVADFEVLVNEGVVELV